jgi:hypothetical protein
MKRIGISIFGTIVLYCCTAHAQVEAGTVIILQLTQDEFVIAADSGAIFSNKPPDDSQCKIAALDRQFVVGVSGAANYVPGGADILQPTWDAIEDAKRIARIYAYGLPGGSGATVSAIADLWASNLQSDWRNVYAFYPDRVIEAAKMGKGILTNGLFAFSQNGIIAFTIRSITFSDQGIQISMPPIPDCTSEPCASGMTDVPLEFIKVTSQRAREEKKRFKVIPSLLARTSFDMVRAVRLVDLTITYDPSGMVGGPIDALELFEDGSIRWFSRKCNCPEN